MSDRWALVTGAAGDLGGAIGLGLARDGWSLHLCDHPSQTDRLEAAVTACTSAGATAYADTFDVTDEADVERAVKAHVARYGAPAAVVANAGVQGEFAALPAYPVADLRRVLEVNVVGVFTVVAAAARAMVAEGAGGAMVLMSSMAGVSGAPNMPAYSAAKAAVLGLARSAAKDLAPHRVRVNAVSPAFIGPGAMWDNQVARQAAAGSRYFATDPAEVAAQMIAGIPLGRYGSPGEVADVVCYLVGERSTYLTGTNTEVSGGSV